MSVKSLQTLFLQVMTDINHYRLSSILYLREKLFEICCCCMFTKDITTVECAEAHIDDCYRLELESGGRTSMFKMKIRMKNKHKTLPENIYLTTYALVNFLESRYKARLTDIWYAQTPHVDIDEIGSADIKNPTVEFPPTLSVDQTYPFDCIRFYYSQGRPP